MKNIVSLFVFFTLFVSCTNIATDKTNYVPFQSEENGKWGMISLATGEVLFEPLFENELTIASDDRFFVKNGNGLWELYSTEKQPQRIGTEYLYATTFKNGRSLVSEEGKPIMLIDKDANVIKELDKVDGLPILYVWPYSDGRAVYKTKTGYGLIDENGAPVVKPDYCAMFPYRNKRVVAIENKYTDDYKTGKLNAIKYTILDDKGDKVFELNGSEYSFNFVFPTFFDGKIIVNSKNNNGYDCLLDESGKTVTTPSEKTGNIEDHEGDLIAYRYGGVCGLIDLNGNIKIRPQYSSLSFYTATTLIACSDEGEKQSYNILDLTGNKISNKAYDDFASINYEDRDDKNFLAKYDGVWHLIDVKGQEIPTSVSIYNVSVSEGDDYVESGLINPTALLSEIGIAESVGELEPNILKNADKIQYVLNKFPASTSYNLKQELFKDGFGIVEEKHNFVYDGYTLELEKDYTDQIIKIEKDSVAGYDMGYTDNKEITWSMNASPKNAVKLMTIIITQTLEMYDSCHINYTLEEGWDKVEAFSDFSSHQSYSIMSKLGRIEFHVSGVVETNLVIKYTPSYRFE